MKTIFKYCLKHCIKRYKNWWFANNEEDKTKCKNNTYILSLEIKKWKKRCPYWTIAVLCMTPLSLSLFATLLNANWQCCHCPMRRHWREEEAWKLDNWGQRRSQFFENLVLLEWLFVFSLSYLCSSLLTFRCKWKQKHISLSSSKYVSY